MKDATERKTARQPRRAVLVTCSWYVRLPDDHMRVGISRGTPRGMAAGYRRYPKLFPGKWFNSVSPAEYRQLYFTEVLDKLDPERVVRELTDMCDGAVPALACFEKPPPDPSWCHRALVSAWLHGYAGLTVYELGAEHCGCGWDHPKMHPSLAPRREGLSAPVRSVNDPAHEVAARLYRAVASRSVSSQRRFRNSARCNCRLSGGCTAGSRLRAG